MDWENAKFFDRVIHSLWLDPEDVRRRFDVVVLAGEHRALNDQLIHDWRQIAHGSNATVVDFRFRATGNAKRKLLRRLKGHVRTCRGGLTLRQLMSLDLLEDYVLAYDIVAGECGGALVGRCFRASPVTDL